MKAEYDSRVLANQQLMLIIIIIIEARNMYSAYLYFPYQHKLSQQVTSTSRFTIMNMKFRSKCGSVVLGFIPQQKKLEINHAMVRMITESCRIVPSLSLERPVTKKMTKVGGREVICVYRMNNTSVWFSSNCVCKVMQSLLIFSLVKAL